MASNPSQIIFPADALLPGRPSPFLPIPPSVFHLLEHCHVHGEEISVHERRCWKDLTSYMLWMRGKDSKAQGAGADVLLGRGHLVCVAACNDVVVVATSRGYVLRYQWDDYGNEKEHCTKETANSIKETVDVQKGEY
eukprot:1158300-Pelagomonas_calceolata.AAC.3